VGGDVTVTADQAHMLATLGLAMRPYGAPRFNAAGINAQIRRVERMALHEVALVVVAVCTDPSLETPASIGDTRSRHWAGIHVVRAEPPARDVAPIGSRCTVCSLVERDCRSRWSTDHQFTRPIEPLPVDARASVVAELKGHLEPTKPRPEPAERKRDPHVEQVRELLHTDTRAPDGEMEESDA
jgi:hypothetical protein